VSRSPYVYLHIWLNATYLHVREVSLGQVVSKVVVVANGITATGGREVLGLAVGDDEEETHWRAFPTNLKSRGLSVVGLVISNQHAGMVAALGSVFRVGRTRAHVTTDSQAVLPWPCLSRSGRWGDGRCAGR
jgi:putative transposase